MELKRIRMRLRYLACQCAGSAAELRIVLVHTVLALDNQLAVGEIGIVNTFGRYRYDSCKDKENFSIISSSSIQLLTFDGNCLLASAVAIGIARRAAIDAGILGGYIMDDHAMRVSCVE